MSAFQNILKLSVAKKNLPPQKLWNSIPSEEIKISASQKNEIDRRLSRMKKGETKFLTWDEVKKNL